MKSKKEIEKPLQKPVKTSRNRTAVSRSLLVPAPIIAPLVSEVTEGTHVLHFVF